MPTLIQHIGQIIKRANIPVECGENEMLVTISLQNGRKQMVKIRAVNNRYGNYSVLRFQSRVCVANGSKIIRDALKANAVSDFGAFALDTTVSPPVIDVVYGYIITPQCELMPNDLFATLQRLAAFADTMEQRTTISDVF